MDWLGRIFDITKLPSKFFAWVVALSAAYLFLPLHAQAVLHLDSFPKEYKSYAGTALVAAGSFLAINFTLWVWEKIHRWFERRTAQVRVVEAITQLDHFEQAVLREFLIQGKHVIELPVDHPTVAGLLQKKILSLSSRQGYRSLAGSVFPVSLANSATILLESACVGLPANPTDEQWEEIRADRPDFLHEIARYDRWRGGF